MLGHETTVPKFEILRGTLDQFEDFVKRHATSAPTSLFIIYGAHSKTGV